MNFSEIPWWGWMTASVGSGLVAWVFMALAATWKRLGSLTATLLATASFLAALFCCVTGIIQFLRVNWQR